jgi:hypothetical protein
LSVFVNEFMAHLNRGGVRAEPGLDDAALTALEVGLGATLPEPVRALYRACGGIADEDWNVALPMRPMRPVEVLDDDETLRESADVYGPSPDARYLFTDDGSNWAGVYVVGPLTGMVTILDHDAPSVAPRFRDLPSFLEKLSDAGLRELDWPDMASDYPLGARADAALVAEAAPLAQSYLDQYRTATDPASALTAARVALHLLPASEWPTLREFLSAPSPFVRYLSLRVAEHQRPVELTPALLDYAQRAGAADNYGHWLAAYKALLAIGADPEVDLLARHAPSNWIFPRRAGPHRDGRTGRSDR